jgi:Na+/phosphate symporter
MAKRRDLRRLRRALALGLPLLLLGVYAVLGDSESGSAGPGASGPILPEEKGADERIEILEVKPAEVTPGGVVEVLLIDTFKQAKGKLGARFSVRDYAADREMKVGYRDMEVVHAAEGLLVLRIPKAAFPGRAKLRVGYDPEHESKPYDLRVERVNHRKLFREMIGGLALLVFGMRVMSRGSRQYTGQKSQGILSRIAKRTPAAVGLGVIVGGVTQFTTTAAGLVVGLVESHLLAVRPAVAILLGATLGAAVTPSVLGLASTREGLLVVAVGVLLIGLAADRRGEAFGKIVLGCGLLFFGLSLLRQGFQPLVSDPEIFPYIDRFNAGTLTGRLTCVAAGALLTAILQGPAPVFVLILGLAQATGHIDLPSALAILAGSGLGAAIGTAVVAWPFGPESRRLGRLHLTLGLAGTAILAVTVGLWAGLAEAAVPGSASEVAYGKKTLLPLMGRHLVVGFAVSQVAITALLAAATPLVMRLLQALGPDDARRGTRLEGMAGEAAIRKGLERVFGLHKDALGAVYELCTTGHRAKGSEGEHVLADARVEIEHLFSGALRAPSSEGDMGKLRQASLATVQLQRALEDLLRHAEKSTEQNLALSPAGEAWQLPPREAETLKALHGLLLEGLETLVRNLNSAEPPDIDEARSREIRLNAMEADSRQGLLVDADRGEHSGLIAIRLNSSELVNAYENVGNHLYRLYETLGAEVDQETPAQAL